MSRHSARGARRRKLRDRKAHERAAREAPARVMKLCGSDSEMGNFVLGVEGRDGTGYAASRALLGMVDGVKPAARRGVPNSGYAYAYEYGYGSGHGHGGYAGNSGDPRRFGKSIAGGSGGYAGGDCDSQDVGRKYLACNGGSIYVDMSHLEVCTPEVLSAFDHLAVHHAMLRITHDVQQRLNLTLPEGYKVQVLANNSDGRSNAYGSHFNFLVTRQTWDDLFVHKLHLMLYLASFQVSSQVITGLGKVGSENRRPATPYQLSQRADFFEVLTGVQTTYKRPIVNSRDETLCGEDGQRGETQSGLARIHCIFYDQNLCHVAGVLKVGMMQIVLAMLEAGYVNMERILDNPVKAVLHWSHGADLEKRCPLVNRQNVTATELQQGYLADARVALEAGVLDTVPRADEIIELWAETLEMLAAGDLEALAGRLDWVLKLHVIERCLSRRPELDWSSPEIKYLEQIYSSIDPAEGLYWAYERDGVVERLVTDQQIENFVVSPPTDTRAWTRAMLLRELDPADITAIDWHMIKLSRRRENGEYDNPRLSLADPLGSTRADTEHVFSNGATPEQIIDALRDGALEPDADELDADPEAEDGEESHLQAVPGSTIR